jgi:hypothetical protein
MERARRVTKKGDPKAALFNVPKLGSLIGY